MFHTLLALTLVTLAAAVSSAWFATGRVSGAWGAANERLELSVGCVQYVSAGKPTGPWRWHFVAIDAPTLRWIPVLDLTPRSTTVRLPLWIVVLALAGASARCGYLGWRRMPIHCHCGYDLGGARGVCPECGRSIER